MLLVGKTFRISQVRQGTVNAVVSFSCCRFSATNEFTAIIERDGEWFILEIPGANGQDRTKEEVRESLAQAIEVILADRREDALRGFPLMPSEKLLQSSETSTLLQHLRRRGCYLKREGSAHTFWVNRSASAVEAVPRHAEISNQLARKMSRTGKNLGSSIEKRRL